MSLGNDITLASITGADIRFDSSLDGAHALTLNSAGTVLLSSSVNIKASILNQGTLQVGNGGTSGTLNSDTIALASGTRLLFNRSDEIVSNSAISGSGSLTQAGSGTLVLSGANSYGGGTFIRAGTLQVGDGGSSGALTGDVVNDAALTFKRSDALLYADSISGSGSLTQAGNGTLVLSGNSSYGGPTTVAAGTLSVNGSIVSATRILAGATLGGSGTVGDVNVESGGTLSPGNSIGTLTVTGNLSFAPGAIYRVETDAAGNSDRVNVSGTALLNGSVMALPAAGNYSTNTRYTILNAGGGFEGTSFSGVSSALAFLTPHLSYDDNNVYLRLQRNDLAYASVAHTRNQVAAANALQKASADAAGDMLTALDAVNNLSAGQAPAAYDRIGGAGLVALRRAGASFATGLGNQVQARLRAVGTAASAQSLNGVQLAANDRIDDLMPALAQAGNGKLTLAGGLPVENTRQGFWLRGYGTDQDTDGDGNAAGTRIKEAGISVGFDTRVRDDLVVGAAFSHGDADVRATFEETGKSRGNAAAVYASYASGPWSVNGNLTLAHHANRMQRRIQVGSLDRTASARFDSRTVAVYGEITYDLLQATWTLQPLAGLAVTRNKADSFTETGADALNLQVAAQSATSARTLLGAKALFDLNGISLQPRAIWAHEFGDLNKGMTAQLQGAPAAAFTVYGVDLPRDALIAGLTIAGKPRERLSLFADVQGEFNSKQTNLGLLVGLRASW
ncbi:MAG: autotransporter domain-containing protein [Oxalicibacterium faecigallinarum]|nr:autotransporter domain-containing protein [Oxalicibacterium faecigallinarum]